MKFFTAITIVFACNRVLTPVSPFTDIYSAIPFAQGLGASYILCLGNPTASGSYSWYEGYPLESVSLTIEYFLHRSLCLPSNCTHQTIWLRATFNLRLSDNSHLTLRNVRLSGQKMLMKNCGEDWCTHCLGSPFSDGVDTVEATDLCNGYEAFFDIGGGNLTIENALIEKIQVRAQNFIVLWSEAVLEISNCTIKDMDFASAFISTSFGFSDPQRKILLNNLTVTHFNPGHVYTSDYDGDSGFIYTDVVENFTLSGSLFEDNMQLANPDSYSRNSFIDIRQIQAVVIRDCVFRRSMHSFRFGKNANDDTILRISNCLFEGDWVERQAYISLPGINHVRVILEQSTFSRITVRNTDNLVWLQPVLYSSLVLNHTQFLSNRFSASSAIPWTFFATDGFDEIIISDSVFIDNQQAAPGEASLISELLKFGLQTEFSIDLITTIPCNCTAVLALDTCPIVNILNLTVAQSNCNTAVHIVLQYLESELNVTAESLHITDANNGFQIGRELPVRVTVLNSIFQRIAYSAINMTYSSSDPLELLVNSTTFEACGGGSSCIAFAGSRLQVLRSSFASSTIQYNLTSSPSRQPPPEAVCMISLCTFTQSPAGDINIHSDLPTLPLTLLITDSSFVTDISGSITFDDPYFASALLRNCSFFGGGKIMKRSVIISSHISGTLEFFQVFFRGYQASGNVLVLLTTGGTGQHSADRLTVLREVVIADSEFLAGVKLDSKKFKSKASAFACRFERNKGVIIWNSGGIFEDTGSSFEGNQADNNNSCYLQEGQSTGNFTYTKFHDNVKSGCLYLKGPSSSTHFNNCVFKGNQVNTDKGVVNVDKSAILMVADSQFVANSAAYGSVIAITNSRLSILIRNSAFQGNNGAAMIKSTDSSNLLLLNTSIIGSTQAFTLSSSILTVQDCYFSYLNRLFLATFASSLTISSSTVTLCSGKIIQTESQSSLILNSTSFESITSQEAAISVIDGVVQISNLTVQNCQIGTTFLSAQRANMTITASEFTRIHGLVITTQDCPLIVVTDSYLGDLDSKGALDLHSSQEIQLKHVQVNRVNAEIGVRLAASKVTADNCQFRYIQGRGSGAVQVQAVRFMLVNTSFAHNQALGTDSVGGALKLATTTASILNCSFISNTAQSGGAIYWTTNPPVLLGNIYMRNQALYGSTSASPVHHFILFNVSSLVMASGQAVAKPIVLGLLDRENQLVASESDTLIRLEGPGLSGTLSTLTTNGLLRFADFTVAGSPNSHLILTVQYAPQIAIKIPILLRNCIGGEIVTGTVCSVCPVNKYSVGINSEHCTECLDLGVCPGDGHLYPKSGSWRPSISYDGLLKCPNPDACLDHSNYTIQTGHCADLYQGNLCQSCIATASRNGPDKCALCPNITLNLIMIAFSLLTVIIIIAVLTRSALKSTARRTKQIGPLLKMLLNYMQVMVLIMRFPIVWPKLLQDFLAIHEYAGGSGEQYMSVDCLSSEPFFHKTIAMAVLPVILILLNMLIWSLIWIVHSLWQRPINLREKCTCSLIVSLFYIHPHLVRISLSCFVCVSIESEQMWLRVEQSILCWDKQHSTMALAAALPTAIIWGLGIPALALFQLIRLRKRLGEERLQAMIGFLYNGYQERYYYWEVVSITRKMIIAALCAFTAPFSEVLQAMTLLLFLCGAALLQLRCSPLKLAELNRVELLSTVVLLLTAYSGLYFSFSPMKERARMVLLVLVILVNCIYLAYVVRALGRAALRRLVRRLFRACLGYKFTNLSNHRLPLKCKHAYQERLQRQSLS